MNFRSLIKLVRNRKIFKFLTISIFGAFTVLLLTILFTSFFGLHYVFSTTIAFEVSVIWTFFANDKWTFFQVNKTSRTSIRFIKYNLFYLISLGIIHLIMIILTEHLGLLYALSQLIAIPIGFFFNFIVSKRISFKN